MPFVRRDAAGSIISVFHQSIADDLVEISHDDPELTAFLETTSPQAEERRKMVESDLGMARVLEDLIDVLIEKGHLMFTDFPEMAQKKLMERRGLRKEFAYMESLFGDEEDDFGEADPDGLF